MTQNILDQLTDTNAILDAVYETIATLDPNHEEEMASYHETLQILTQDVPAAEEYIQALRQELASDRDGGGA